MFSKSVHRLPLRSVCNPQRCLVLFINNRTPVYIFLCVLFCFLSLSVLLNENFEVTFNGMVCDHFFIKSLEL